MQDGGILDQPHDGLSGPVPRGAIYSREMAVPWSIGWGVAGIGASPATHGRGLTNSANKISEHNIYNTYPVLFGVQQLPNQTHAPQTRRIMSRVIPSLGMGVTGR